MTCCIDTWRSASGFNTTNTKPELVWPPPVKRADALDRRIMPNDIDKPGQLLLHQLKRDALVGLNAAEHQSDILGGKKPFGTIVTR